MPLLSCSLFRALPFYKTLSWARTAVLTTQQTCSIVFCLSWADRQKRTVFQRVLRKIWWSLFQGTNGCISKYSLPDLNQENDPSVVYKSAAISVKVIVMTPVPAGSHNYFHSWVLYRDIKNAWWEKEAASALLSSPLP